MFLGHYAAAFAAKRFVPRVSLGILLGAALFLDLIWPVFLLTGLESVRIDPGNTAFTPLDFEHYPISHSLMTTLVWGLLAGGVYFGVSRCMRSAVWVGGLVLSHWALDAIAHRPDLLLAPGASTYIGLGLLNSIAGTIVFEGLLFFAGVWMYRSATRPNSRRATVSFAAFVALLLAIYGGAASGQPPPSAEAVAWTGLGAWLFVFWAAWFDRQRTAH